MNISYLNIYLIIIAVLLLTIYYISSSTCNINVNNVVSSENIENSKNVENFGGVMLSNTQSNRVQNLEQINFNINKLATYGYFTLNQKNNPKNIVVPNGLNYTNNNFFDTYNNNDVLDNTDGVFFIVPDGTLLKYTDDNGNVRTKDFTFLTLNSNNELIITNDTSNLTRFITLGDKLYTLDGRVITTQNTQGNLGKVVAKSINPTEQMIELCVTWVNYFALNASGLRARGDGNNAGNTIHMKPWNGTNETWYTFILTSDGKMRRIEGPKFGGKFIKENNNRLELVNTRDEGSGFYIKNNRLFTADNKTVDIEERFRNTRSWLRDNDRSQRQIEDSILITKTGGNMSNQLLYVERVQNPRYYEYSNVGWIINGLWSGGSGRSAVTEYQNFEWELTLYNMNGRVLSTENNSSNPPEDSILKAVDPTTVADKKVLIFILQKDGRLRHKLSNKFVSIRSNDNVLIIKSSTTTSFSKQSNFLVFNNSLYISNNTATNDATMGEFRENNHNLFRMNLVNNYWFNYNTTSQNFTIKSTPITYGIKNNVEMTIENMRNMLNNNIRYNSRQNYLIKFNITDTRPNDSNNWSDILRFTLQSSISRARTNNTENPGERLPIFLAAPMNEAKGRYISPRIFSTDNWNVELFKTGHNTITPYGILLEHNVSVAIAIYISGSKVIITRNNIKVSEINNLPTRPSDLDQTYGNTKISVNGTAMSGNISNFEFLTTSSPVLENSNFDDYFFELDAKGCPSVGPVRNSPRSVECISKTWTEKGCLTVQNPNPNNLGWWGDQTTQTVNNDMTAWATLTGDTHRRGCYGSDTSKWPMTLKDNGCPVNESTVLGNLQDPEKCISNIWKEKGCTQPLLPTMAFNMTYWKERPLSNVSTDIGLWATLTTDNHRKACYGNNTATYPGFTIQTLTIASTPNTDKTKRDITWTIATNPNYFKIFLYKNNNTNTEWGYLGLWMSGSSRTATLERLTTANYKVIVKGYNSFDSVISTGELTFAHSTTSEPAITVQETKTIDNTTAVLNEDPNSPIVTYIGCFKDNQQRMIPTRAGNYTNLQSAVAEVIRRKKKVFGLQFGGQLWVGDDVHRATLLGTAENCGDLGTAWTNKVYTVKYPEDDGINYLKAGDFTLDANSLPTLRDNTSYIYIIKNAIRLEDRKRGYLSGITFASLSNDPSVVPLLFEGVNETENNYKLVGIGSKICNNCIEEQNEQKIETFTNLRETFFNVSSETPSNSDLPLGTMTFGGTTIYLLGRKINESKYGSFILESAKNYYIGWCESTLTNSGTITYSTSGSNNPQVLAINNVSLNNSSINTNIKFTNNLGNRKYSIFASIKVVDLASRNATYKDLGYSCDPQIGNMLGRVHNNTFKCLSSDGTVCRTTANSEACNTLLNSVPTGTIRDVECDFVNQSYPVDHYCSKASRRHNLRRNVASSESKTEVVASGRTEMIEVLRPRPENYPTGRDVTKMPSVEDLKERLTGATFRIKVNLPNVNPYIKMQRYTPGESPNYFYLGIEKLEPNCSIDENGVETNIYVDGKNCRNKALSEVSRTNTHRFVLVPIQYAIAKNVKFGNNIDFTLEEKDKRFYLKNIQTGLYPKLFEPSTEKNLRGMMINNELSNMNELARDSNILWGERNLNTQSTQETKSAEVVVDTAVNNAFSGDFTMLSRMFGGSGNNAVSQTTRTQTELRNIINNQVPVSCSIKPDNNLYLMITAIIDESTPVDFGVNNGNAILKLVKYNLYGNKDKTFDIIFCNYDGEKLTNIETISDNNMSFFINLLCFDDEKDRKLKDNSLDMGIEIHKYSDDYLKRNSIKVIN